MVEVVVAATTDVGLVQKVRWDPHIAELGVHKVDVGQLAILERKKKKMQAFLVCLSVGVWVQPLGLISNAPEHPCRLYTLSFLQQLFPLGRRYNLTENLLRSICLILVIVQELVFPS